MLAGFFINKKQGKKMTIHEANQLKNLIDEINDLKAFLEFIENHKEQYIKKMYLVLQGGKQIEFNVPLSLEVSKVVYNILIADRQKLLNHKVKVLDYIPGKQRITADIDAI